MDVLVGIGLLMRSWESALGLWTNHLGPVGEALGTRAQPVVTSSPFYSASAPGVSDENYAWVCSVHTRPSQYRTRATRCGSAYQPGCGKAGACVEKAGIEGAGIEGAGIVG